MHLLRALRTVARMESLPAREEVFQDIARRSPLIRLVLGVYACARPLGLAPLLVGAYGFSYFLRVVLPRGARCLGVGFYPNELKKLAEMNALMGEGWLANVGWKLPNGQGLRAALCGAGGAWRVYGLTVRLVRGLSFMAGCRVVATLFLYVRFYGGLKKLRPQAVLVTSDYSPDGAALAAAAGALGITRIYVPHALPSMYVKGRTLLDFELYILDSEAMQRRFAAMWPLSGAVVLRGVGGQMRPMQLARLDAKKPRFGIFLSGLTHMPALLALVKGLERFSPGCILVRGHPVQFVNPDFAAVGQASAAVRISRGTSLLEDADACDLIIAPNSTMFLEVLKFGVPCVYYAALDNAPHDYNGLVADGLLPEISGVEQLDMAALAAFYRQHWEARMEYFDAAYGQDAAALERRVKQALAAMTEGDDAYSAAG